MKITFILVVSVIVAHFALADGDGHGRGEPGAAGTGKNDVMVDPNAKSWGLGTGDVVSDAIAKSGCGKINWEESFPKYAGDDSHLSAVHSVTKNSVTKFYKDNCGNIGRKDTSFARFMELSSRNCLSSCNSEYGSQFKHDTTTSAQYCKSLCDSQNKTAVSVMTMAPNAKRNNTLGYPDIRDGTAPNPR